MSDPDDTIRCENCNARLHKEDDRERGRCASCVRTPESEAGEYVNMRIER